MIHHHLMEIWQHLWAFRIQFPDGHWITFGHAVEYIRTLGTW